MFCFDSFFVLFSLFSLNDNDLFRCFQCRSTTAARFYASALRAMDCAIFLGFGPVGRVSSTSTPHTFLRIFSSTKRTGNGMDSRAYDKTTRRVPRTKRQATSEDFKTHIINDSTSELDGLRKHQSNPQCTRCVRHFKMLKLGNNYTGAKKRMSSTR